MGVGLPADHHDVAGALVEALPILRLGHGLEIDLDVDLGQHGGDCLGDARVLDIAVVGRHHRDGEAVGIARLLHQRLGLGEVEAWGERGIVTGIAGRAELARGGGQPAHDLLRNSLAV